MTVGVSGHEEFFRCRYLMFGERLFNPAASIKIVKDQNVINLFN